jgi:hypothetical protein
MLSSHYPITDYQLPMHALTQLQCERERKGWWALVDSNH